MYDDEVREAYATHLQSFPWDWYSTVTFRDRRRSNTVAGSVWRAFEKLGASRAFLAVEGHSDGFLHVHALSRHLFGVDVRSDSIWRYCFKAFGRSTVEAVRSSEHVSVYCAKYVTKGDCDFFYFGEADAWTLDT